MGAEGVFAPINFKQLVHCLLSVKEQKFLNFYFSLVWSLKNLMFWKKLQCGQKIDLYMREVQLTTVNIHWKEKGRTMI